MNAIAPGLFPSEMTTGESGEDQKSQINRQLSNPAGLFSIRYMRTAGDSDLKMTGRPGSDSDMAACILYLAGPGGLYLNGQVIYPDGGVSSRLILRSSIEY